MAVDVLVVTGYGLVVAFTTLPVLSVIGVLLGTRQASRGLWLALGYAGGLAIVFGLAAFGVAQLSWARRFRPTGWVELAAGLLLVLVATGWLILDRRRANRGTPSRSNRKFLDWMGTLGPVSCAMVGFQFAFHPENLVLTIAAATRVTDFGIVAALAVLLWFCAVGVSTVAIPSIIYARSGDRVRERLQQARDWLESHGTMITVILLFGVGAILIVLGVWKLLG